MTDGARTNRDRDDTPLEKAREGLTDQQSHLARSLLTRTNLAPLKSARRLFGGRNNQAFKLELEDRSAVVLKFYHHDPIDKRERLKAEWSFLEYVWARGVRLVPEPIMANPANHCALIGFVSGVKKKSVDIGEAELAQATDFVAAINADPHEPQVLASGSEACFSLQDHIAIADRRVKRLETLDPQAPLLSQANDLVTGEIMPAWAEIRTELLSRVSKAGMALDEEIADEEVCISPSDFGFHNALAELDGTLTFIDFEYAGRDDPAKLICDFLCQPELPVPNHLAESTMARFADALGLSGAARERAEALLSLYKIKWICIMLNEFHVLGSARRDFAEAQARESRCQAQLEKVRYALSRL